ncbi:type II toxin-antitoxin system RelE/ParE family toxin [Moraxella nasovis]|uniref:type II toxin-antitoxin system RelE/ParE family toxin n=1 Tax=Moraxella nasovis TaxID=2904121 RepID=UPI001F60E31B|nr:type II toxin-antitoxin system RelE/ParE family toxin [Moraxella nasovis]UNU73918.1 type II toxin-antitoxin system RelE/ParE family toxin [Moraxella nasovis]
MAFNILIRSEAQNDIAQIAHWYKSQANNLDKRFLTALEHTLEKLSYMADSHAIIYQNTRKILLHKFPYAVHYQIDGFDVIVFAVLHGSQNPINWQIRADNV